MPISSQLPDEGDIDDRLQNLKDSGLLVAGDASIINKKLNDLAKEVKQGQVGAKGEVTFLERQVFGASRRVEIIPEATEKNVKRPDYIAYYSQGGALRPEVIEVKTTNEAIGVEGLQTGLKYKIKQANKQLKKSEIAYGIPGSLEMQFYDRAQASLSSLLWSDRARVELWIAREFRPDQMTSLRRVAIYGSGELLLEFMRTAENQIIKTFPKTTT